VNKWLNSRGDPDTDPNTDPDPYRDTGKTCLGGGMHCPSASSFQLSYSRRDRVAFWTTVHNEVVVSILVKFCYVSRKTDKL